MEIKSKSIYKPERTEDITLDEKQLEDGHQEYMADMKTNTIASAMK